MFFCVLLCSVCSVVFCCFLLRTVILCCDVFCSVASWSVVFGSLALFSVVCSVLLCYVLFFCSVVFCSVVMFCSCVLCSVVFCWLRSVVFWCVMFCNTYPYNKKKTLTIK